jgi:lipid A ethanolaminephosphotransferase
MARRITVTPGQLTLLTAAYVVAALNGAFWTKLFAIVQPTGAMDYLFIAAFAAALIAILDAALSLVALPLVLRPLAAALVIVSATLAYFVREFGTAIDTNMVRNLFETDTREAIEFATPGLFGFIFVMGIVPALLIAWVPIAWRPAPVQALANLARSSMSGTVAAVIIMAFFASFASIIRENRGLLFVLVPSNAIAAGSKYLSSKEPPTPRTIRPFGEDAHRDASVPPPARPLVTVLVVGETARSANFSLNGYDRQTNPRLAAIDGLLSFKDVSSCGTDTAHSLPCMFSGLSAAEFTVPKAAAQENLLDILQRAGLDVLWRDNQSGCKGVCRRVATENLAKLAGVPFHAESASLDEALLDGLALRLEAMKNGGMVVLHMIGSHGPAYYLRVPPSFARFRPTCNSRQFSNCTNQQIVNSYDNTILYTDHVLGELVGILRAVEAKGFDTAMIYVSDHGESLGEKGLYLHGMPRALAPKEQTHIPMIMWASSSAQTRLGIDMECAQEVAAANALSHDNLFHTVLGMYAVRTRLYDQRLDILQRCRAPRANRT